MPADSPRVTLRRLHVADVPMMLAMESDPEVMRHSTGVKAADDARRQELLAWLDQPLTDLGHWAIALDGKAVGWVSLTPLEDTGRIQLAYRLCREAWGLGCATQAAAQLCDYAWQTLDVPELIAVVWPGNAASRRVLEKLGFAFAGMEQHYGRATQVYALPRPAGRSALSS
ncbi:GNAT family N-acetyltransferase [Achromobacter deleyi]|uniref:GNAT family N-acetyltransferase n=1 Tax=Achromobacter deleyi TaxID=1353891 RepID=UPI001491C0F7|nr:GNAT family N-acetyltransferase [Achromobacter deleyi]QVQ27814.1 GNAT family N-acetyltransferase [Achromobacter deleyi]UIP23418.1 GNAT family N-acetyltransferase [Achromobacter deleyi]